MPNFKTFTALTAADDHIYNNGPNEANTINKIEPYYYSMDNGQFNFMSMNQEDLKHLEHFNLNHVHESASNFNQYNGN